MYLNVSFIFKGNAVCHPGLVAYDTARQITMTWITEIIEINIVCLM